LWPQKQRLANDYKLRLLLWYREAKFPMMTKRGYHCWSVILCRGCFPCQWSLYWIHWSQIWLYCSVCISKHVIHITSEYIGCDLESYRSIISIPIRTQQLDLREHLFMHTSIQTLGICPSYCSVDRGITVKHENYAGKILHVAFKDVMSDTRASR